MASVVHLANISRIYRSGNQDVQALRSVTLRIEPGEFVAIMGKSGSGKSTLLHLLGLLERPTEGDYLLEGEDVSRLSPNRLSDLRSRKIGFVFQNFNLLPRNTALENIELPLFYAGVGRGQRRSRAEQALELVGLTNRKSHWPHQLSGGEQQRVAIARAIVNQPLMILADEPTGALDSTNGTAILALFKNLNEQGRTVVMVTHDADIARHASRIVTLSDGKLISDDTLADRSDGARATSPRSAIEPTGLP